jgi:predicted metal-dependent RNase
MYIYIRIYFYFYAVLIFSDVGRSCILLTIGGKNIMMDCATANNNFTVFLEALDYLSNH